MKTETSTVSPKPSVLVQMIPVMLCFFAMGFVDLVGTASNYVQKDLGLTDAQANLFPSLVFFWFLIFSVPTGLLMNRIGRKNTVLLSLVVTLVSLVVPMFGEGFAVMLLAFSMLGIGNALMQTSLNPLVSNLIGPAHLASALTFGQFVKAIASFLAPLIAAWGATTMLPTGDLGWRMLFPVYAVVCLLSIAALGMTRIEEEKADKASGFGACLRLLGHPFILFCFLGIICHVGIDVGTNATAPKLLIERQGMALEAAGFATSIYFIFRMAGSLLGAIILRKVAARTFFGISAVMMLATMVLLFAGRSQAVLYAGIALIGLGNSNIFPIIFAQALGALPEKKNEVSGLMIMGLFGGTVFPLAMGIASDTLGGQYGAVGVMTVGVLYLLFYWTKIKRN